MEKTTSTTICKPMNGQAEKAFESQVWPENVNGGRLLDPRVLVHRKQGWDAALNWARPRAAETIHFLKVQIQDLCAAIGELKGKKKRSPRKPVESSPTSFVPPAWLPVEVWSGFEEMRKRTRKPLTDRARQLTVSSLLKLKAQGEDPIECLNQSVQRAWQGVFAVAKPYQSGNGNGNGHHSEPEERPLTAEQKRKAKESSERVLAKYREEADRRQGLLPDAM